MLRFRSWTVAVAAAIALTATIAPRGAAEAQATGAALTPLAPPVHVRFALNWIPISEHIGAYVALEKGYWKDLGLDVEISRGFGSTDSVKRAAANSADVALADASSLIIATSQDPALGARIIAIEYQRAPYIVVYLQGGKIHEPKDLAHAVHGGVPGAADTQFYPAFLKAVGLAQPAGFVAMDAPAKVPALLLGKIDAMAAFMSSYYPMKRAAEKSNKDIGYWLMADHGINPYSLGIVASDKTIRERPEVLKRFLKGWADGWAYTSGHADEAAAIFKKHNAVADQEGELMSLKAILPLIVPPATADHGIGFMTRDRWAATVELTARYMDLKRTPPLDQLYTTTLLPKVTPLETWK